MFDTLYPTLRFRVTVCGLRAQARLSDQDDMRARAGLDDAIAYRLG